jgi:hypothetical protein
MYVATDSVEAFEKKLTGFTTCHVQSTCRKQEFIPWLKQAYKAYRCDTIISLSLGGSNSDEVIGVRYGKKDPSLKKFILIGGHCDVTCGTVNTPMQGGNDNTTGQVAVLESCRVHQYYKFDYTILYCSFNGEETGLNGSKATCTYLKNLGAQTIGGNFSYDMFGISKTNMTFSVYDKIVGAAEFQKKLEDMKSTYKLVQPTTIKSTTTIIINTMPKTCFLRLIGPFPPLFASFCVFLKALITPFSEILAGHKPTITGYFPGILVFLACVTGNNLFL